MEMTPVDPKGAPPLAHAGRRVLRLNAALTLGLLLLIAVLGNVLASRHLGQRVDLSADQLNAISDAARRVVDRRERAEADRTPRAPPPNTAASDRQVLASAQ